MINLHSRYSHFHLFADRHAVRLCGLGRAPDAAPNQRRVNGGQTAVEAHAGDATSSMDRRGQMLTFKQTGRSGPDALNRDAQSALERLSPSRRLGLPRIDHS